MHCLEHILLVTSVAVDSGKAELVRVLESLAGLSHYYVPEQGNEPAAIQEMNVEWHRRFEHLMHGNKR